MKNDIVDRIFKIESELSHDKGIDLSLFGGAPGIALFYNHLYEFTNDTRYLDKSNALLVDILDKLSETEVIPSLAGGYTGIAWTMNYFASKGYLEESPDDLFEDMHDYIYQAGKLDLSRGYYDFLHGGSGPLLFAINRLPNEKALHFIEFAIQTLSKAKQQDEFGYKWQDTFSAKENEIKYNLGLAHGMPSLVLLLLKIYEKGVLTSETSDLANGVLRWILHHKNKTGPISCYPSHVLEPRNEADVFSRMAWCYGDLTIALMFWRAGNILNNAAWKAEALRIMEHNLSRIDPLSNPNLDAGLCHGTAGIAHLFKKFYIETNNMQFLDRSSFWIDQTLKRATFNDTLSGYKSYFNLQGQWSACNGLVEGTAGIGLILLSYLDHKNDWDECLLLS